MVDTPVAHDHIVLLLNTPEFENLPSWLTENFNIIEGGIHAGMLFEYILPSISMTDLLQVAQAETS